MAGRLVTVYRGEPMLAQQALAFLRSAGINAEIVDAPASPAGAQKTAIMTIVLVGVGEADLPRARRLLERWSRESGSGGASEGRGRILTALLLLGPPVVALAIRFVPGMAPPNWVLIASIVWMAAGLAVVAIVRRRRGAEH